MPWYFTLGCIGTICLLFSSHEAADLSKKPTLYHLICSATVTQFSNNVYFCVIYRLTGWDINAYHCQGVSRPLDAVCALEAIHEIIRLKQLVHNRTKLSEETAECTLGTTLLYSCFCGILKAPLMYSSCRLEIHSQPAHVSQVLHGSSATAA